VLQRYNDFARGVAVVRHHHESWDGTGYPHRLKGTDIPFGARVIAVADTYDAMTSDRPYRKGMSPAQAARILRDGRGVQWDPVVVDAWLRSIAPLIEGTPQPALRVVPYVEPRADATA
jgi:HD-GYP domain-containing protein (c-di-GMP phosphodiesterase class II)